MKIYSSEENPFYLMYMQSPKRRAPRARKRKMLPGPMGQAGRTVAQGYVRIAYESAASSATFQKRTKEAGGYILWVDTKATAAPPPPPPAAARITNQTMHTTTDSNPNDVGGYAANNVQNMPTQPVEASSCITDDLAKNRSYEDDEGWARYL
jgi:hypothetical protein